MKLFLFVALFAVSASALTSVNSVDVACLSEELQALVEDIKDYYDQTNGASNDVYETTFFEFLEPKLERYEAAFRAKLRKALTNKWTSLFGIINNLDELTQCFRSLMPSLVEQAVKFARDNQMGMEQMVEDIEQYILGLEGQTTHAKWISEFNDSETGFKETFILTGEMFRNQVYQNLLDKSNALSNLFSTDPVEFHKIMLLYVRGAVEKAVKDAAVYVKDDLKTSFQTALIKINENQKYNDRNIEQYQAKIMSTVEELICDFLPNLRCIAYAEFEGIVNCWINLCDVATVEKHLWYLADHITTEIETEWNKVKDDVTIGETQSSPVKSSPAPATTTPCASPSSWSNRRPATNWWNC